MLRQLYNNFTNKISNEEAQSIWQTIAEEHNEELKEWGYTEWYRPIKEGEHKITCQFTNCRMRKRCLLYTKTAGQKTPNLQHIMMRLPQDRYCPFFEWFLIECFKGLVPRDRTYITISKYDIPKISFLIDVPDTVSETGARDLNSFIYVRLMLATQGTVILMATRKQNQQIQKQEGLARIGFKEFPPFEKEEMIQMYRNRLKYFQDETVEKIKQPFTKDCLEFLIKRSGRNPRRFFQSLSKTLSAMSSRNRLVPADREFTEGVLGKPESISADDAFAKTIEDLLSQDKTWVKVKVIGEWMESRYNIKERPESIGRRCKKRGFTHRNNPNSEYYLRW